MGLIGKIKYWIDNASDKVEDQEPNVHSRRKFLFTLPALVMIPTLVKPVLESIGPDNFLRIDHNLGDDWIHYQAHGASGYITLAQIVSNQINNVLVPEMKNQEVKFNKVLREVLGKEMECYEFKFNSQSLLRSR